MIWRTPLTSRPRRWPLDGAGKKSRHCLMIFITTYIQFKVSAGPKVVEQGGLGAIREGRFEPCGLAESLRR